MGRPLTVLVLLWGLLGSASAQSPLNPPGWSDLYTQSGSVGLWINAQRICGLEYDPVKLSAHIAQLAGMLGVSVNTLMREGQLRADEAVPHTTDDTCRHVRRQAIRLDLLPGKPRNLAPSPPPPVSLVQ